MFKFYFYFLNITNIKWITKITLVEHPMVTKPMKKQGTKPTLRIICLTRLDNRKCIRGKANMLDNTNESNFTTQMHQ